MRDLFLLDPDVIFLNHGSFGACPVDVFQVYQDWQRELERQPVEFIARRSGGLLLTARQALAAYLGTHADNLVFITNTTEGVNTIARSLQLNAGDEILGTTHEYGACEYAWRFACEPQGARYVPASIPLPLEPAAFVEHFWAQVTPRTRVIFMSHITSVSALILPIAEIIQRARAAGILTVIDGAHAPSQLALNLEALGADFYTGNLHKWLCAPKGAAFLYARAEHHAMLHALTVSWGYTLEYGHTPAPTEYTGDGTLVRRMQYQGTRDLAAFLSVPAAIDFQANHHWDAVRERCHAMCRETSARVAGLTGLAPVSTPDSYGQMVAMPVPHTVNAAALKTRLYDDYRIEIPITEIGGQMFVRVSYQAYNTRAEADALVDALVEIYG